MKNFLKNIWKYILPLVIGLIMGVCINIPSCQKQPEPKIEYVEKHDTIRVIKDSIVYKTKPVNVYFHDTMYVKESGDTVKLDSLPITEYVYQDTINTDSTSTEIKINYHGFDAGIDDINLVHNYFEKQTTIVKEPKKVGLVWYIGIGVGVGGQLGIKNNVVDFNYGPQVGIHGGIGIGGRIK